MLQNNEYLFAEYELLEHNQVIDPASFSPLKIANNGIVFFDEVLSSSFSFFEISKFEWLLVFFRGSEFEKQIRVVLSQGTPPKLQGSIGSAFECHKKAIDPEVVEYAQQWLSSRSLRAEDFTQTSATGFMAAIRRGFMYVSETPGQFERAVILHGLALAYKFVMQNISRDASEAVNSQDKGALLRCAELGSKFNIAFYSRYPIKLENAEIRNFWEVIEEHFQLENLNDELSRQLSAVQELIQFQISASTTQKNQSQMIWLSIVIALGGLAISLISTYIAHLMGWNN